MAEEEKSEEAQFDRKAYQREYMRTYMRGYRERKKAEIVAKMESATSIEPPSDTED